MALLRITVASYGRIKILSSLILHEGIKTRPNSFWEILDYWIAIIGGISMQIVAKKDIMIYSWQTFIYKSNVHFLLHKFK